MAQYTTTTVDGLSVFYREAGDPSFPKLVLRGGFSASSDPFRYPIPVLADQFHASSPDYPGFGNADMFGPAHLAHTFASTTGRSKVVPDRSRETA